MVSEVEEECFFFLFFFFIRLGFAVDPGRKNKHVCATCFQNKVSNLIKYKGQLCCYISMYVCIFSVGETVRSLNMKDKQ